MNEPTQGTGTPETTCPDCAEVRQRTGVVEALCNEHAAAAAAPPAQPENKSSVESTQPGKFDKASVLLHLKTDLLARVDKYKADCTFESRTEAVRQLLVLGLREWETGSALKMRVERLEEAVKKAGWL